ncbi:MAG: hypothetical protein VW015_03010, partial [Pontimonas sp.]
MWKSFTRTKAPPSEEAVWVIAELATMLRAGLTPDRAFEEIARRREPGGITDQVWRARTQGQS